MPMPRGFCFAILTMLHCAGKEYNLMTKLKDLKKERLKMAQKKRGVEFVINEQCGCQEVKAERYWTVKIPLMATTHQGRPATVVVTLVQCNGCKKILDGRGEIHQKPEKLIELAR